MCHVASFESSDQPQLDLVAVTSPEQSAAVAQKNRHRLDLQLVEMARSRPPTAQPKRIG